MKPVSISRVKDMCNRFVSNFLSENLSSLPYELSHTNEWKESEDKLEEITLKILETLGSVWRNPAFCSEFVATMNEGTYVNNIIVPLINACLSNNHFGESAFITTFEQQSIASADRRGNGRVGKRPDIMFISKEDDKYYELMYAECSRIICMKQKEEYDDIKLCVNATMDYTGRKKVNLSSLPYELSHTNEWKESEDKLEEITLKILETLGSVWRNPAFCSEFVATMNEGTYVNNIIVPLINACLSNNHFGESAFITTFEQQSIASADRRGNGRVGKRPDIMFISKEDDKYYELMYAECSRIICMKQKEEYDDIKLCVNATMDYTGRKKVVEIPIRYSNDPSILADFIYTLLLFRNTLIVNMSLLRCAHDRRGTYKSLDDESEIRGSVSSSNHVSYVIFTHWLIASGYDHGTKVDDENRDYNSGASVKDT
ncbi:hypothetical protein Glove_112g51 [Diversispora epigaea]|uniref:Uncharacterized protein n=1 Tax=Diversispora epigaea TaxID=1348612 RepID=A0A397J875_9GLOM|nr:hypothetical protein Glove_112g51 [Diversispora epigaea]